MFITTDRLYSADSKMQKIISIINIKTAMAAGEKQMPIHKTAIGMTREKK